MMESKEYDVFLEVLARLSDEVALTPSWLANLLLKEKLIPKTMWQNVLMGPATNDVKASTIMVALESKISGDKNVMYQLLDVLRQTPDLNDIVKDIEKRLLVGEYCRHFNGTAQQTSDSIPLSSSTSTMHYSTTDPVPIVDLSRVPDGTLGKECV